MSRQTDSVRKSRRSRGRPRRPFGSFKERHPEASLWVTADIQPASALALARAGIRAITDLEGLTRNHLLSIPGVGLQTVEALERILNRPLPRSSQRPQERHLPPVCAEVLWCQRGIPTEAAITFAQLGLTLDRLRSMSREDLLALHGVGPQTLHACEILLGQKIPSSKPVDPVIAYWRDQGFSVRAARALRQAGFAHLDALAGAWLEELRGHRGLGEATRARLEVLLGRKIPSRSTYWRDLGLVPLTANALARAGIHTLEDLARLSRSRFLALPGLGPHALRHCQKLLGHRLLRD